MDQTLRQLLRGTTYRGPSPGWAQDTWASARATLLYVQELAANVHFDVEHWDVLKMFRAEGAKRRLVTDKNEINRIFFERYNQEKEDLGIRLQSAVKGIDDAVLIANAAFDGFSIESRKRHRDELERKAIDHADDLAGCIALLREVSLAIDEGKAEPYDLKAQVMRTLEAYPFYEFLGAQRTSIKFVTRTNIVLTEKNPAAGLNISVDLGRFVVQVDSRMNVLVFGHADNITVRSFLHPHVNSNGQVCFGTAFAGFLEHAKTGDIPGMLGMVMAILCQFNPENPYAALAHFRDEREKAVRAQELVNRFNSEEELARQAREAETHDPLQTYHHFMENEGENLYSILVHTAQGVFRYRFTEAQLTNMNVDQRLTTIRGWAEGVRDALNRGNAGAYYRLTARDLEHLAQRRAGVRPEIADIDPDEFDDLAEPEGAPEALHVLTYYTANTPEAVPEANNNIAAMQEAITALTNEQMATALRRQGAILRQPETANIFGIAPQDWTDRHTVRINDAGAYVVPRTEVDGF